MRMARLRKEKCAFSWGRGGPMETERIAWGQPERDKPVSWTRITLDFPAVSSVMFDNSA